MDSLLHRFGSIIKGSIEGFDRLIFKGTLKPISFALGMQAFLRTQGVLNKDYKDWVTKQSASIIQSAEEYSQKQCGRGIIYIPSINTRKEQLAHNLQKESGIKDGLIGVWSCVESCNTFKSTFDATAGFPSLRPGKSRCKHLYFYYDHKDYGFMSIRLQTWAPYGIQIAINGREWLRRSLDKEKCKYIVDGNKFLHIDDYELTQKLLNSQLDVSWEEMLSRFSKEVFPTMAEILGESMKYYWTLWQSEMARDYIFNDSQSLTPVMESLLRHAVMTGTCDRVLKYMGRPVKKDGQPHPLANPELLTKVSTWHDGLRVRHYVDNNSVKFYNQQNVLRIETTMNNPHKYLVQRYTEADEKKKSKKLLPMRKGIADINLRAKISVERNKSFAEQLATVSDKTPVSEIFGDITHSISRNGKKFRSLDITGKDKEILRAISDPAFNAGAITNKALQEKLIGTDWAKGFTGKKLSSKINRQISLLRSHGIIRKLPNQHKYALTDKGRKISSALNALLSASTEDLVNLIA
ncbi:MAG: hypothetical protein GXX85_10210 [Ignavibacteria bacterium]|nr:hypothetical protein [Ignavibacteria bacterium]